MTAFRTLLLALVTAVVIFTLARRSSRVEPWPASAISEPEPAVASTSAPEAGRIESNPPDAPQAEAGTPGTERGTGASPAAQSSASVEAAETLASMSETARNTTLLIAVREAGFTCTDLVSVSEGAGESGGWRVSCSDARAYLLGVDDSRHLRVEPLYYGDAPAIEVRTPESVPAPGPIPTPIPVPAPRLPVQPVPAPPDR
ncbi:MAG TPA: hypothetical protein VFV10_00125 [Gammaproteobacteria bacterium]|nr:hypothetical protein [Gammaproteobacteria bacterium]